MNDSNENQNHSQQQNFPPTQPSPPAEISDDEQARLRMQAEQAMYREFMQNQPKLALLAQLGSSPEPGKPPEDAVIGQLIEEICKRICMLAERARDENGAQISEYWAHHVFQTLVAPMWAYGYQAGRWPEYLKNEAPKALAARYDAAKHPLFSGGRT